MLREPSTILFIFIIVFIPTVSYAGQEAENKHFEMGFDKWNKWEKLESLHNSNEHLVAYCAHIVLDCDRKDISDITSTQIDDRVPVVYKYPQRNHHQTPYVTRLICNFRISEEEPIQSLGFIRGPDETVFLIQNPEDQVITIKKWVLLESKAWVDVLKMNLPNRLAACQKILNGFKQNNQCETKLGLVEVKYPPGSPIRKHHTVLKCITMEKNFIFIGSDSNPGEITKVNVMPSRIMSGKSKIIPDWNQ